MYLEMLVAVIVALLSNNAHLARFNTDTLQLVARFNIGDLLRRAQGGIAAIARQIGLVATTWTPTLSLDT